MIVLYKMDATGLRRLDGTIDSGAIQDALWIDLLDPAPEEEALIETTLGLEVPTREEMAEIEESSRLYRDDGALYMTAVVISGVTEKRPARSEATFVLTAKQLITIRYTDTVPFRTFEQKCSRQPDSHSTSDLIFASLVGQIIERIADILQKITSDLDGISREVFEDEVKPSASKSGNITATLQALVKRLGRNRSLLSKMQESLLSFGRLLTFFRDNGPDWQQDETKAKMKSVNRDMQSLTEYDEHLAAQIDYLQEAIFNLINLEQNRVIKVFTIAAVLFLPPTLVATIYGMNFKIMPELDWLLGYPFALLLIGISALIPFVWFKRNNWL